MRLGLIKLASCVSILALSACGPALGPVPPPVVRTLPVAAAPPSRPFPPGGAASTMRIPIYGLDGVRITPNRGLSRDETIWNFRSAINVAALNCQGPVWNQVVIDYNKMLVTHKTRLSQASKAVDGEYQKRYPGQNGLRVRDTQSTSLYNYFSLPPVKQEFCDTALRKVQEVVLIPSSTLPEYTVGALADIDGVFLRFFDAYVQYERDLADWNQRYGPRPVAAPVATAPSAAKTAPKTGT